MTDPPSYPGTGSAGDDAGGTAGVRPPGPSTPSVTSRTLQPWAGLGVFCLYAAAALAAAFIMISRCDA